MHQQFDLGILILRLVLGLFLAYHGYNKVFGGGGLSGTAGWFASMGMKLPKMQARLAAATEILGGLAFAAGLLTPVAAGAMVALMIVAIVTVHAKVGFFIFLPNGGWEYCATIAFGAIAVATMGSGKYSIDNVLDVSFSWWGLVLSAVIGVVGAFTQLALFYRPSSVSSS